jgi:phytoene dehydrogenase-like protein
MKTIIIGSGMAGLTAGAYLAKGGHQVTIYEQFPTPGGVTATVRQDGFSLQPTSAPAAVSAIRPARTCA